METKKGGINFVLFLLSNFMKLCRNIHRSVWQLFWGGGVEQIQNGGRFHGNQDAKNVKFTPYSGSF
jgi:hypothetical protein